MGLIQVRIESSEALLSIVQFHVKLRKFLVNFVQLSLASEGMPGQGLGYTVVAWELCTTVEDSARSLGTGAPLN